LRGELGGLDKLLDSDIDLLATELGKPRPDRARVLEIVETLKAKWALKEDEVVLRVKRLMAALEFLLEAEKLEPAR
jgi:hypothetical protein